ncbi:hypothetical protein OG339_00030 [Streptosporangium sp. NBC_01495]|uniref:hypothetical protein n=1 Tax=Streptosporangium sp. NBC_01495 TaxID=2903899 RepID=UPI002E373469|nr:hypothetical protein [Streptosporangium sp. NBC_01495]
MSTDLTANLSTDTANPSTDLAAGLSTDLVTTLDADLAARVDTEPTAGVDTDLTTETSQVTNSHTETSHTATSHAETSHTASAHAETSHTASAHAETSQVASAHAETELRRCADALLTDLAAGTVPTGMPADFEDVSDHWLAPAVEALVLLLRGEESLEPLARAAQRDEQRTALFLCLALAVAGQGDRIHASWLGTAFGELSLDRPVTHGQRALWLAAARGAYGPAGKIFVLRKLDAVAASPASEPDRWLRALIPDEPSTAVSPALAGFGELAELPELAAPVHAAARLTHLLDRCAEITSARESRGGDGTAAAAEKPDSVSGSAARASGETPDRTEGAAGGLGDLAFITATQADRSGEATVVWSEDEPLTVLRQLTGSGTPERPMRPLTGHLLGDLRPGSHPYLAAIALHVAAPIVRAAGESLAEATRAEAPESVTIPILGHRVTLRPEGPDPESLGTAEERITTEGAPARGRPWAAYALLALAPVILVVALVLPVLPLALLAPLPAVGGAYRLWRRRQRERADAEYVVTQLAELRDLAQGAVWALHEYAHESEGRIKTATSDLAELTRLLRRGPRAG